MTAEINLLRVTAPCGADEEWAVAEHELAYDSVGRDAGETLTVRFVGPHSSERAKEYLIWRLGHPDQDRQAGLLRDINQQLQQLTTVHPLP